MRTMTSTTKFGDIEVRIHPAAGLFPMMSDAELDELAADIAKNGLRHDGRAEHAARAILPLGPGEPRWRN
jgi:hypothetical protein